MRVKKVTERERERERRKTGNEEETVENDHFVSFFVFVYRLFVKKCKKNNNNYK